jgi:hypothetical protein
MFAKEDIIDGLWQGERFHSCRVSGLLEHRTGADALQRPLRSRFQARLRPSVARTAKVKSWPQMFSGLPMVFCTSGHRQSRSQEATTVAPAALRGLAPTFLASVGGLPHARPAYPLTSL